jgi:PAS domain S-box-containing protein
MISDELLSAFLSLMPDAAVVVDAGGRIVSLNPRAEELFGYPSGALAGVLIETLVPERARHRHRQHRAAFFASPDVRPMGADLELSGRRRDGYEFPVDISLAPITSGGAELVVAAVRDVTDKRAAAAAQTELATIVRSSLDAIMSTTLEGRITSWNPAAEALFGYSREEILGTHIATLVPPEGSVVLEELLALATEGASRGARDTRWRHRGGHDVDVAVSVSPLRDPGGALLGFSSMARDISERKRAEDELHRLLAEEERLEHQHAATAEIRLALLSDVPLSDSLSLICQHAGELLGAPVAVISIGEAGEQRVAATTEAASELFGAVLPAHASFAQRVLATGQHILVTRRSAVSSVGVSPAVPDGPTLGVPIVVGGVASAALTVVRREGAAEFSTGDLAVAENLAAQAALALELERARQDREQMMLIGDRERIARDLHDHVIQQLFATGMALQSTLPLVERSLVGDRLIDAIDSLDETIREIRNTIYNISRPFDEMHLRAQIVELVDAAEEGLGFVPALRFEGPVDAGVSAAAVPHVFAVLREALSNVARHAAATAVSVQVSIADGKVFVTVADNGVGVTEQSRRSGLANLEERARLLGGSFAVTLPAEGGTRLDWVVPLDG